MIAEHKRTGKICEFTLEQWRNLERTDHAIYWKIIDAEIMPRPVDIPVVKFSEGSINPVNLTVAYKVDYKKLLNEAGIKYNRSIKNPEKLRAIYESKKDKI